MSYYQKNAIIATVATVLGIAMLGIGGILSILDGKIWELVLAAAGLLVAGFGAIADN